MQYPIGIRVCFIRYEHLDGIFYLISINFSHSIVKFDTIVGLVTPMVSSGLKYKVYSLEEIDCRKFFQIQYCKTFCKLQHIMYSVSRHVENELFAD